LAGQPPCNDGTPMNPTAMPATLPRLSPPVLNRLRASRAHLRWWWHRRRLGAGKRALDLLLVVPALGLLAPLFAVVALAIWLHDRGPVLFWQTRVGLHGVEFGFPKFRSMRVDAEAVRAQLMETNQHGQDGVTFKMKRDPRITPVGRWIRRTSIDELPQLWCVLRGSMSLVGPRPPLVSEVARYSMKDRQRLSVVPGLTCIWQVSGRSEVPFPQQVEMDLDYIRQPSLWADILLLLKTLPAVIRGRGAY
jgi:lipopolysaccharide/colanic/teichoic acid biosynthesis glycosyltransferase